MTTVALVPWSDADRPLLDSANAPEMTVYLNGPESAEDVEKRHAKYLRLCETGEARMFRIEVGGVAVGSIGWWKTEWNGEEACETGWFTLPQAQGRGYGSAAVELIIADARAHSDRRLLIALPRVDNVASNALCARAGFTLHGTHDSTFRGQPLHSNVWALELRPE